MSHILSLRYLMSDGTVCQLQRDCSVIPTGICRINYIDCPNPYVQFLMPSTKLINEDEGSWAREDNL